MLPRSYRLTTEEFSEVYQKGVAACGAFVCVHIGVQTSNNATSTNQTDVISDKFAQSHAKFACTIGKKQLKSAVKRNRTRRQLYGAVDNLRKTSDYPAHNFIIRAKLPLDKVTPEQLTKDIANTVRRALLRFDKNHQNN